MRCCSNALPKGIFRDVSIQDSSKNAWKLWRLVNLIETAKLNEAKFLAIGLQSFHEHLLCMCVKFPYNSSLERNLWTGSQQLSNALCEVSQVCVRCPWPIFLWSQRVLDAATEWIPDSRVPATTSWLPFLLQRPQILICIGAHGNLLQETLAQSGTICSNSNKALFEQHIPAKKAVGTSTKQGPGGRYLWWPQERQCVASSNYGDSICTKPLNQLQQPSWCVS